MNPIAVTSGRSIGDGHPCFIAAEVGINHNGDVELAHRMIDAAADAGVDAVKFQNYHTEDFIADRSATYTYVSQGKHVVESQLDMFKRNELDPAVLKELREHSEARGIVFFSTPTSSRGVADLVEAGATMLKNGSDFLGNLPLIRAMAETGLPTIIANGMATVAEMDDAVRAFRDAGGVKLILLQCTSSYPTPPEDVNLRKIPVLAAAFGCPAGLSDHTDGVTAAIGAVAIGACFVEKHFTLDKRLPGPDHWFSADPSELRSLVESVRIVERSLGTSLLGPTASETEGRREYRLSVLAARDLRAGERVTAQDVRVGRPGTGVPVKDKERILGLALAVDVPAGRPLTEGDFR